MATTAVGALPLHLAAPAAHPRLLRALIAAHPDAAAAVTGTGRRPLATPPGTLESLEVLLAAAPGAVSETCLFASTPLHVACGATPSGGQRERGGGAPLCVHVVCLHPMAASPPIAASTDLNASSRGTFPDPGVVRRLLAAHPDAARRRMKHGRLPLHFLVSRTGCETAAVLLEDLLQARAGRVHGDTCDWRKSSRGRRDT